MDNSQCAFEVMIDDLGARGDGIAHHEGQTLFVAGALPHERVRVVGLVDPARPVLEEILCASPHRVDPACPHYMVCGGCRVQHMCFDAMTAWKERELYTVLAKEGLDQEALKDVDVQPSIVTPPASRRRARMVAHHARHGVVLGFNKWRSQDIVDVLACPVLVPELAALLPRLRVALARWLPKNEMCDIQLTQLADGLDVVLIGGRKLDLESRELLGALAQELDIAQLSWKKWDKSAAEAVSFRQPLMVRFGAYAVPFPAGSFLQASEAGEAALIQFAQKAVGGASKILDLFCGLGGFGLSMPLAKARSFADLDGPAIASLSRLAKGMPKTTVTERNLARDAFSTIECNAFDAIIFDPPRGGAKAQAERLASSTCPCLVAISCDPVSFARDAKILMKGGYKLVSLQPVDQFLWSPHLEVAALFRR